MSTPLDLDALLASWEISLKSERRSRSTIAAYLYGVRAYLTWCRDATADHHLDPLSKPLVRAWVAELLQDQEPATARLKQLAVRRFTAWLTEEGEIAEDPLLGLRPPKLTTKLTRSLTDDECQRLITACSVTTYRGGHFLPRRDEAAIRLMLETGLRAGEAIGLWVADVDLPRGLLLVRHGKGAKQRVVPFGPHTARALDRYLRVRKSHSLAHTKPLFLGTRNHSFTYQGLRQALLARAQLAGIKGFHPHLMRHTAASRWLAAGGSEGGLMAVAGWSDRGMIDRYTRSTAAERPLDEARRLGLGEFG